MTSQIRPHEVFSFFKDRLLMVGAPDCVEEIEWPVLDTLASVPNTSTSYHPAQGQSMTSPRVLHFDKATQSFVLCAQGRRCRAWTPGEPQWRDHDMSPHRLDNPLLTAELSWNGALWLLIEGKLLH